MRSTSAWPIGLLAGGLLAAPAATACTLCHSPAALELRALFASSLPWGLLGTAAPIVATLAAAWIVRELVAGLLGREDGEPTG